MNFTIDEKDCCRNIVSYFIDIDLLISKNRLFMNFVIYWFHDVGFFSLYRTTVMDLLDFQIISFIYRFIYINVLCCVAPDKENVCWVLCCLLWFMWIYHLQVCFVLNVVCFLSFFSWIVKTSALNRSFLHDRKKIREYTYKKNHCHTNIRFYSRKRIGPFFRFWFIFMILYFFLHLSHVCSFFFVFYQKYALCIVF